MNSLDWLTEVLFVSGEGTHSAHVLSASPMTAMRKGPLNWLGWMAVFMKQEIEVTQPLLTSTLSTHDDTFWKSACVDCMCRLPCQCFWSTVRCAGLCSLFMLFYFLKEMGQSEVENSSRNLQLFLNCGNTPLTLPALVYSLTHNVPVAPRYIDAESYVAHAHARARTHTHTHTHTHTRTVSQYHILA